MTAGWYQKAIDKLVQARQCLNDAFNQLNDDHPASEMLAELIENTYTVEETLTVDEGKATESDRLRRQQIIAQRLTEI